MKYWLLSILVALFAYFSGSLSTMVLSSNFVFRTNLLRLGRGNRWLSNFTRVHGAKGFLKLALVELVKDTLPLLLAGWLFSSDGNADVGRALAAFCLILGRTFPMIYDLRGGYATVLLVISAFFISISAGILVLAAVAITVFLTRYLSVGTLVGAVVMVVACILVVDNALVIRLFVFTAVIIFFRMIPPISRISSGREEKLSFEKDISYKFDE